HPLADREFISHDDLRQETLIAASHVVAGPPPIVPVAHMREVEVSNEAEMFDLVAAGFGVILATHQGAERNRRHDVVVRQLVGPTDTLSDLLVWHPMNDSPLVKTVCRVADELQDQPQTAMVG